MRREILLCAAIAACSSRTLSDRDLSEYAAANFDAREMQGERIVLGTHQGIPVIVEFPCADACPTHTTRIIRYDLPADDTCTSRGGVIQKLPTPVGVEMVPMSYCVPKVLGPKT